MKPSFPDTATTHRVLLRVFRWLAYQTSPNRNAHVTNKEQA